MQLLYLNNVVAATEIKRPIILHLKNDGPDHMAGKCKTELFCK